MVRLKHIDKETTRVLL